MRIRALVVAMLIGLSTWVGIALAEDVATKNKLLSEFFLSHEWGMGNKKAVWLMKFNSFEQWDEVAAVFGYIDNMSACEELKDGLKKAYPAQKYICQFID